MFRAGVLGALLIAAGCGFPTTVGDPPQADTGSAEETGDAPITTTFDGATSMAEGTSGAGDDAATFGDDDESEDESGPNTFIMDPDGGSCGALPDGTLAHCSWCDLFAQDCPRGEKCTSWASSGDGVWDLTRCVEVIDDPDAVGEPCTVEGNAATGIDSCEFGSMCFYVDPDTLEGTCVAFCEGDESNPLCAEGTECSISNQGALSLCLQTCDPLGAACPAGQSCYATGEQFSCVPSPGEPAALGEACDFIGSCEAGLVCLDGTAVGCADTNCCTAWCNVDAGDPNPACAPEQTCTPWYADGDAPAGLEHVGVCILG